MDPRLPQAPQLLAESQAISSLAARAGTARREPGQGSPLT